MLNRKEKIVMRFIYDECNNKESCLLPFEKLFSFVNERKDIDEQELNKILTDLEYDDYFDVIYSERKGEKFICITMHNKGKGFLRELKQFKRTLYFKIALSLGGAVLAFILTKILVSIF